jgi:hypothetical protein
MHRIVKAMREGAPNHTIIADADQKFKYDNGTNYDHVEAFLKLKLVPDVSSVVFTFHDYQPMVFTHQGMSSISVYKLLSGLDYPMNEANVAKVYAGATSSQKKDLDRYKAAG